MPTFVVLLRGVNVGRANRLAMADFAALLASLGCTGARTLLNSGNAVCSGPAGAPGALAHRIQQALHDQLGVEAATVVLTARQWQAACAHQPWAGEALDPSRLLLAFGADAAALASLAPLAGLVAPPERFHLGAEAAYLWCPGGVLASRAGKALLGRAGRLVTSRNWATVLKLQALLAAAPG